MTDIYTQENGSKKKFLAPVLVILLCMVSLTAAGYAYNATMSVPEQGPDAGDLQINFATPNPATDIHPSDDVIVFTDNFVWSVDKTVPATPVWSYTNEVKAFAQDGFISYDLKVTGEGVANKLVVKLDGIDDYLALSLGNNKTIGDLVQVKVGKTADVADAVELTDEVAVIPFTKAANASVEVTLYVFFVALDDDPVTVQVATPSETSQEAADFKTIVENHFFSLEITADSEAPASP